MPFSDAACHPILAEAILERLEPGGDYSFLDCGVGCGLTGKIIKRVCPEANLVGLEIYAPYVTNDKLRKIQEEKWGLYHDRYDSLLLGGAGDFRRFLDMQAEIGGEWEFVVFGASLEHVKAEEAEEAIEHAKKIADHVLVTLPLAFYVGGQLHGVPQGEVFGNPREAHLKHWHLHEVEALGFNLIGKGGVSSCLAWDKS